MEKIEVFTHNELDTIAQELTVTQPDKDSKELSKLITGGLV